MEKVHDLYKNGCYQEIVQSVNLNEFSAVSDPLLARVLAAAYFQLCQFSEALSLLKEIESCFTADPHYLSLYGACLRRCGDFDAARDRLEQALKVEPDNPAILNNFANLLIDLDDYERAESILDQLLVDDPEYNDARVNLLRLKERQRIYQMQLEDSPISSATKWSLADPLMLAFGEDEVQRTRPKPAEASQNQPELKKILPPLKKQQVASDQLALAIQAVQEGRHVFALQLCSQVHQVIPTSASLFECISDAYIALQRFAEAEVCLLHALLLGAKSFKLYANLVSLLCIRKDYALARHYLELASILDASNPLLSKFRQQIANSQKKMEPSIVRFDQVWPRPELTLNKS